MIPHTSSLLERPKIIVVLGPHRQRAGGALGHERSADAGGAHSAAGDRRAV